MATATRCGKPAVGRFHYVDTLGQDHAAEPLCQGHATALYSRPEPSGTARAQTPPTAGDTCTGPAGEEE